MKIRNFILKLVSVLVILGALFYYQSIAVVRADAVEANEAAIKEIEANNKEVKRRMVEDEQKAKGEEVTKETGPYKDGTYDGEAMGYGGIIQLSVTVVDGFMDSIDVYEHNAEDPAYYYLAEAVIEDMIEAQDAQVDTISGATLSSTGLIQAADNALKKAVK